MLVMLLLNTLLGLGFHSLSVSIFFLTTLVTFCPVRCLTCMVSFYSAHVDGWPIDGILWLSKMLRGNLILITGVNPIEFQKTNTKDVVKCPKTRGISKHLIFMSPIIFRFLEYPSHPSLPNMTQVIELANICH